MGMAELEKSRAEAETELDQLRTQKSFITNEVIALKENLNRVRPAVITLEIQKTKLYDPAIE